jgi:uncharacterized membrane protein
MSEKFTDVMIAGYLIKEPAMLDYEAVIKSGAKIDGVVLATRDLEGKVSVEMTDHLKRTGAVGLGAAGFVVGLFAPPLLLATAVGAAFGAAAGHLAENKMKSQIEKQAEETIPWGGAGLIVAYPRESGEAVDKAVSHALKKVVGEAEGSKTKALKAALADAQQKSSAPPAPPAA